MGWTRGCTIGRGSTATVSVAEFHGSDRKFVVKSAELDRSELLRREQSILSTLECPQIVAYKGCDTTFENGVFMYNLFMEYAPYGSIADEIRKLGNGGFDEFKVRCYARQILLGLDYLHSNGIVHCDLKGQNVLVYDDGVKIADFGCSRRISPAPAPAVAGTPAFMAPEAARGERQDFSADVWALGCVVLEMVTGKSPWYGVSDPVSVLYRVGFAGEAPEIPDSLSEQGRDFVDKCLKIDPNERWSASELLKHEFVKESRNVWKRFDDSSSNSPTSVLMDRCFWDSDSFVGSQKNRTPGSNLGQNPAHDHFFSWDLRSASSRIGILSSSSMPNWECDGQWITVRESSIRETGRLFNGQESNKGTENCWLDCSNYIREDNFLFVTDEPRTVSIVELSEFCDISHDCCNRESFFICSLCINNTVHNRNFLHDLFSAFHLYPYLWKHSFILPVVSMVAMKSGAAIVVRDSKGKSFIRIKI